MLAEQKKLDYRYDGGRHRKDDRGRAEGEQL